MLKKLPYEFCMVQIYNYCIYRQCKDCNFSKNQYGNNICHLDQLYKCFKVYHDFCCIHLNCVKCNLFNTTNYSCEFRLKANHFTKYKQELERKQK